MDKQKAYRIRHADRIRETASAWRSKNRHKRRAHQMVQNELKCGRLVKPTHCSSCGKESKVQAHHSDYLRPLDVSWLCPACHFAEHGNPLSLIEKKHHHGEEHGRAKLTEASVLEIKQRWNAAKESNRAIAKSYGVSEKTVRLIIAGEIWKHTNN